MKRPAHWTRLTPLLDGLTDQNVRVRAASSERGDARQQRHLAGLSIDIEYGALPFAGLSLHLKWSAAEVDVRIEILSMQRRNQGAMLHLQQDFG